jgi:hypothetical protein
MLFDQMVDETGYDSALRVAWTLADLAAVERPGADQVQPGRTRTPSRPVTPAPTATPGRG